MSPTTTDADILALVDAAFMGVAKPAQFHDPDRGEESAGHNRTLRIRDRATLDIEDVGDICRQPITGCAPQGIAYYFPALARLALAPPTHRHGWYGDTLEIHLSSGGHKNPFLAYCNPQQRQAVAALLGHLNLTRVHLRMRMTDDEQMRNTQALWRGEAYRELEVE